MESHPIERHHEQANTEDEATDRKLREMARRLTARLEALVAALPLR
jgi:hypothetical protein